MKIPLERISFVGRARKDFGDIERLATSIKLFGLLHPIVVQQQEDNTFRLIAGDRRVRAAMSLGWPEIEATLREDLDEVSCREIELEENVARKDFTWVEKVLAENELHELKQSKYGARKQGVRTDLGKVVTGWGLKDTAESLDKSIGIISEDLALANAIKAFPALQKESSITAAKKKLKALMRKAAEVQLARDAQDLQLDSVLLHGDGIKLLHAQQPGSIDLIIVDPPWGIDIDESASIGEAEVRNDALGNRQQFADGAEHALDLMQRLLPECANALRPDRHMFIFAASEMLGHIRKIASQYFEWVDPMLLVWNKTSHSKPRPYGPAPQHELLLHFMKGKRRPQKVIGTVLDCPRLASSAKVHPTQKPTALLRQLIEAFTLPGETVCDPMMGSGSTCVAAVQCYRRAIGFELDQTFYNSAMTAVAMEEQEAQEQVQSVQAEEA